MMHFIQQHSIVCYLFFSEASSKYSKENKNLYPKQTDHHSQNIIRMEISYYSKSFYFQSGRVH